MAKRGGNQWALTPPNGKDLYYGRLLFEAIWKRHDGPGRRFAKQYERLYQRWRRLVIGIIVYNGGVTPLGPLEDTERDLENLELHHRSEWYPKPRPLTTDEQACLEWRNTIATEAIDEIYLGLERPLNQPMDWDGTQEPWKTWQDTCTFLATWADEPAIGANPDVKRKRWRRRTTIVNYRQEVAGFCDRWRIKAWWALPAIIQHQLLRADHESRWDSTLPPLSLYTVDSGTPVSLPLTVKLSGRTEEQFKRDRIESLNLVETTILQGARGPIRVVRNHFSREERVDWEWFVNSSCVTLDWDGRRHLPQGVELITMNRKKLISPGDYLVDQCQQRLGRSLKYLEARDVRGQAWGQQQEYRARLGAEGWAPLSDGNRELIATKVARLLLAPKVTWARLTPDPVVEGKNRYGDSRSIQRACKNFAVLASLTLPQKHAGRKPGSRSINH